MILNICFSLLCRFKRHRLTQRCQIALYPTKPKTKNHPKVVCGILVARGGIEPPTQGFSNILRLTAFALISRA